MGLLGSYKELFVNELKDFNVTNVFKVSIETIDQIPVYLKSTLTAHEDNLMKLIVDKLSSSYVIRKSFSQWSSPARPQYVNGKLDIEIDYSYLNSWTFDRFYQLPNVRSFAYSMGRSNLFSKLVIKDAFYQIGLTEDSKTKTAFATGKHLQLYIIHTLLLYKHTVPTTNFSIEFRVWTFRVQLFASGHQECSSISSTANRVHFVDG